MAKTPEIKLTQDYLKNYIINGNLDFWQRGTSATQDGNPGQEYLADRWYYYSETGASIAVTQEADVPNSTSEWSLKMERTGADIGDISGYPTVLNIMGYGGIEGYDLQELIGKKVTLSFNVKADRAITLPISFRNSTGNRSLIKEYTINNPNVWEEKEITFEIESGTYASSNGLGLGIRFGLAIGDNFTTANTDVWQTGDFYGSDTNQGNITLFQNSYIQISQVMLNIGSSKLPFARAGRNISEEFALCQRYYSKSYPVSTDPGTVTYNGALRQRTSSSGTSMFCPFEFNTSMRTIPTMAYFSPNSGAEGQCYNSGVGDTPAQNAISPSNSRGCFRTTNSGLGASALLDWHYTADAEFS